MLGAATPVRRSAFPDCFAAAGGRAARPTVARMQRGCRIAECGASVATFRAYLNSKLRFVLHDGGGGVPSRRPQGPPGGGRGQSPNTGRWRSAWETVV